MKFFMPKPFVTSTSEARKAHGCMRRFAKQTLGIQATNRKVYRIEFVRDGTRDELCVGQHDFDSGETVVAILRRSSQVPCVHPEPRRISRRAHRHRQTANEIRGRV